MSKNPLEEYLASNEDLLLSFTAQNVSQGGNSDDNQTATSYIFGATDRRIVYLDNSESFKDIDYQHISSIESSVDENTDISKAAKAAVPGCCGGFTLVSSIGAVADDPASGIIMILIAVGFLAVAVKMYQSPETTEKQQVKFITGDEAHQQIEVTLASDVDSNVSAELSQILREQR